MPQSRVGIKDVAAAAGVSSTTVSHVLNDVDGVRVAEDTRIRVRETADRLGYSPSRVARSLRLQRTHTVGLLGDQVAVTPFAGEIILGAQKVAVERHVNLVLFDTGGDPRVEDDAITALHDFQVDGVLYARMYHQHVRLPPGLADLPTVLLDAWSPDGGHLGVVPDETGGARAAIDELLTFGHTRIGYLDNADDIPATRGRMRGYRESLAAAGLAFDPTLVAVEESVSAGGYRAARALLSRPDRPTALFCFNDRMAMGAYRAAAEAGLGVPQDLSVVSFDNQVLIAEGLYPPLTSVALPHREMGRWAATALLDLVDGVTVPPARNQGPTVLACPLVRRNSIAPAPTVYAR